MYCISLLRLINFSNTTIPTGYLAFWRIEKSPIPTTHWVYQVGTNAKGDQRILCDQSCSSSKRNATTRFQIFPIDDVTLLKHAQVHHLQQLNQAREEGRSVDAKIARYLIDGKDCPLQSWSARKSARNLSSGVGHQEPLLNLRAKNNVPLVVGIFGKQQQIESIFWLFYFPAEFYSACCFPEVKINRKLYDVTPKPHQEGHRRRQG